MMHHDAPAEHAARIRIANNGLFPVHADFWLRSDGAAAELIGAGGASAANSDDAANGRRKLGAPMTHPHSAVYYVLAINHLLHVVVLLRHRAQ